jgi:C2 domain-containing protein 3
MDNRQSIERDFDAKDKDATQVQFYLNINEVKLTTELTKQPINLYLVCRLFWCSEKLNSNTCWNIKKSGNFNFTESMTLFLSKKNMNKMHNNYMIVEVWTKKMNKADVLYGMIKIPLNQFYVTFMDKKVCELFFKKSKYPCVSVDTWLPCMNPFSGQKTCEVNILMAMGTNEQIVNLQEFKFNRHSDNSEPAVSLDNLVNDRFLNEYLFEIKFDQIKNLKLFDNMIWGETDCFIQYYFPVVDGNFCLNLKSYRTSVTLCTPDINLSQCLKHLLKLNCTKSLKQHFFSLYNSTPGYMPFEIWLRHYHPNVRDQIIGKLCLVFMFLYCLEFFYGHIPIWQ